MGYNDYNDGYRAGQQAANQYAAAMEEHRRKEEQLNRFKTEVGYLNWETVGSEHIRKMKASMYGHMVPQSFTGRDFYIVLAIIIIVAIIIDRFIIS